MNSFVEDTQIVHGFGPVNMATAANTGAYVSMKGWEKCLIRFKAGEGTAGEDPTLTVTQATAVAGTGAKELNFTKIYRKQAADFAALAAVGTYTVTTQTAANTYTNGTSAEDAFEWIVEITADMLDVSGGFDCVAASVADVGTDAQLGVLDYILMGPRYTTATVAPSALAD